MSLRSKCIVTIHGDIYNSYCFAVNLNFDISPRLISVSYTHLVRFAVPFSLAAVVATVKSYAEFTGLTVSSEFPEAAITFAAPVSCDTIVAVKMCIRDRLFPP